MRKNLIDLKRLQLLFIILSDEQSGQTKNKRRNYKPGTKGYLRKRIKQDILKIMQKDLKAFVSEDDIKRIQSQKDKLQCALFHRIKEKLLNLSEDTRKMLGDKLGISDIHKQSILLYAYYFLTGEDIIQSGSNVPKIGDDSIKQMASQIGNNEGFCSVREMLSKPLIGKKYEDLLKELQVDKICSNFSRPQINDDTSDWMARTWIRISEQLTMVDDIENIIISYRCDPIKLISVFLISADRFLKVYDIIQKYRLLSDIRSEETPQPFMSESAEVIKSFLGLATSQINDLNEDVVSVEKMAMRVQAENDGEKEVRLPNCVAYLGCLHAGNNNFDATTVEKLTKQILDMRYVTRIDIPYMIVSRVEMFKALNLCNDSSLTESDKKYYYKLRGLHHDIWSQYKEMEKDDTKFSPGAKNDLVSLYLIKLVYDFIKAQELEKRYVVQAVKKMFQHRKRFSRLRKDRSR